MESHSIEYWQMPGHESFIIPSSKKNLPKGNDIDSDDALRQYFFRGSKKRASGEFIAPFGVQGGKS